MLRLRTISSLAAVAVAGGLAGCQDIHKLGDSVRGAFAPADQASSKAPGPKVDAPKPARKTAGTASTTVKQVQARLDKLGFDPGPVDGVAGDRTTEAIERYQARYRLPVTGKITPRLLKHLDATTAKSLARVATGVRSAAIALPSYRRATTFVYSDGSVDRVVATDRNSVEWVRRDGASYKTHRNFMLPRSYWREGGERGTAKIASKADTLWPGDGAAEVRFSADFTVQRRNDSEWSEQRIENWRCQNEGKREITVPSGTFDTVLFVCHRETKRKDGALKRAWYYANKVRHYVRFVETVPGKESKTVDLMAVRPGADNWPPIVRAALARAVVQVLESPDESIRKQWSSSAANARVTIEAKAKFQTPDGRSCRRFSQTWSENKQSWHYPALACKADGGNWKIPFLAEGDVAALATSGEEAFQASDSGTPDAGQLTERRN